MNTSLLYMTQVANYCINVLSQPRTRCCRSLNCFFAPFYSHLYTVFYPIFHDFYRIDTQTPNDQIKLSKNLNQLIARQGTRDAQDCGTKMSSVMRWVISLTTEVRPGLGQHFISRNYLNNL